MDLIEPHLNIDAEEVVDYEDDGEDVEELPINIESCLLLNNCYIESIDELKEYLVSKMRENDCRQSDLKSRSTFKTVKEAKSGGDSYSHPNSLIPFMAPYFKDVKGLTAPPNVDTIEKKTRGEINESYVCTNKQWNVMERQRLKDIVETDSIKLMHEPLRNEKELLSKDKTNLRRNVDKINELTQMIDAIGSDVVVGSEHWDPSVECVRWDERFDWLKISATLDTDHSAEDCELYWNNFLHPKVTKSQWTKEEDKRLEELVAEYGMHDWDRVAEALGTGRLAWQVCARYQSELNRDLKRVGPLTKVEAETVEKVIESCRVGDYIPWHQVKYFIEGRSLPQIKHYWNKVNVVKRGDSWSDEENKVLTAAVRKFGTHNWRRVAQYIPGRSNRQCRERYMMRLNFGPDRKLGNWTEQEDSLILELAPKHNYQWVKLEAEIRGRNARQIASRYELLKKYKSKGIDVRKTGTKVRNKSSLTTRTLTVRNRLYDKIRQMSNRNSDQSQDLDKILRIGRAKLAKKLEMEATGVKAIKGRPRKSAVEEDLDTKIVEMFASYDHKSSHKKLLCRSKEDQCVYNTTKEILNEQLMGKRFESDTDLAKAIRLLFEKSITCRPNETDITPEPQTSSGSSDWKPPPILPPNRTTFKGLRTLLLQRDHFSQMIAKSKIPLETFKTALEGNQHYDRLFAQFKSLFIWPALLSMEEPPERQPTDKVTEKVAKPKQRQSWLKTQSSRMIQIRSNQTKLIQSEIKRTADNKSAADVSDEPLNETSDKAPWYVTEREKRYYPLKSLDKSSFVFTRQKPIYDSMDSSDNSVKQSKRKIKLRVKSSDESDCDERDELMADTNAQNKRQKKKKSNDSEVFYRSTKKASKSDTSVEERVTRSHTRRVSLRVPVRVEATAASGVSDHK